MYSTSTQKRDWTFASNEELQARRRKVNEEFRAKYALVLQPGEEVGFLDLQEEEYLLRMVAEKAVVFGDTFRPQLYPSIRWTAFAYFKRFYLSESPMEFSPKVVMTSCYYVAAKIDEFYVTIGDFVENLQTGTAEQNAFRILAMEPEIMRSMQYQLTVHCPFRPFEGHLIEMKRLMLLLNFDIESLRAPGSLFLRKCLLGDAMLLYSPSQIALAGVKYALDSLAKSPEVLRDFLFKLLGVPDDVVARPVNGVQQAEEREQQLATVARLTERLDAIIACVLEDSAEDLITNEMSTKLQHRMLGLSDLIRILEERLALDPSRPARKNEPVDSDED